GVEYARAGREGIQGPEVDVRQVQVVDVSRDRLDHDRPVRRQREYDRGIRRADDTRDFDGGRPARDLTRAGSEQAALFHDELRETARGVARIADLHVSDRQVAVLHRQVQLPVGDLDTKGGQRVLLDDDDAAL